MKKIKVLKVLAIIVCVHITHTFAVCQVKVQGKITDEDLRPISSVSIKNGNRTMTVSDRNGFFEVDVDTIPIKLQFVHLRFEEKVVNISQRMNNEVVMSHTDHILEEVEVNTGYYRQPKERVTGSFTVIDREHLDLNVDNNILKRLEGFANSLYFDKRGIQGEELGDDPAIRIRGLSTIEGNTMPLVIVDDFPYPGDINDINPNDIENITILRDAAASSIWGAQAGNGVIVITTKKARFNSDFQIGYNSNMSFADKPDLYYNQNYLPPSVMMDIEKELFERGAYVENNVTQLPAFVELLIAKRDGSISEDEFEKKQAMFRNNDLRADYLQYLYQIQSSRRHGLHLNKGGENLTFRLSLNTDNNLHNIIGNKNSRLNGGIQVSAKLLPRLDMNSSLWYARQKRHNNGEGYSRSYGYHLYESLYDENGNPAHIGIRGGRYAYYLNAPSQGLLDWMYRPVEDIDLMDDRTESVEWRTLQQIKFTVGNGLDLLGSYQYNEGHSYNQILYDKDSHRVRHLVNRFTQTDGRRIVPYGAIFESKEKYFSQNHAGRVQLNFNKDFGNQAWVSALAGADISQASLILEPNQTLYNFDKEAWTSDVAFDHATRHPTRPSGSGTVPSGITARNRLIDRNLSYFSNFGYGLLGKYTASASIRWDGSNLLGVKINDKGTLLWSAGIGWDMMKENFMDVPWMNTLKWRATYGVAGNIDKSQSHYPTIRLSNNAVTNQLMAILAQPGNPSLSWEKVNTLDIALDWNMFNGIVQGTADYYIKDASNLLGNIMLDPSTGINGNYKINYADLQTRGLDLQINTRARFKHEFVWNTTTILNMSRNQVKRLNDANYFLGDYFNDPSAVRVGRSVDQVYALPWYGLDNINGMPLMKIDGELTSDESKYASYYLNFPIEALELVGQSVPKVFGSFLNTFSFRSFSFSTLLSYRFGHVFRRKSIGPGQEYLSSNPVYHTDYLKRWEKPGDELHTDVPAWAEKAAPNQRFAVYQYSEALIEPADVVRFDNIQIAYTLSNRWFRKLKLYAQCNNVGIVWRANDRRLDPDYIHAFYPPTRNITCGIQIDY